MGYEQLTVRNNYIRRCVQSKKWGQRRLSSLLVLLTLQKKALLSEHTCPTADSRTPDDLDIPQRAVRTSYPIPLTEIQSVSVEWYSYGTILLWYSYGMVFLWYGTLMVCHFYGILIVLFYDILIVWYSYGIFMVRTLYYFYGFLVVWCSYGTSLHGILWYSYSTVLLWYSYGIALLWHSYGIVLLWY
jgi:hypothetical protein